MPPLVSNDEDTSRITAWRCIGCGKIEAPQPCIGVCQDRKVELVDGAVHDELRNRLAETERARLALAEFAGMVARSTPHDGQWEQSYRKLQEYARRLIAGETGD